KAALLHLRVLDETRYGNAERQERGSTGKPDEDRRDVRAGASHVGAPSDAGNLAGPAVAVEGAASGRYGRAAACATGRGRRNPRDAWERSRHRIPHDAGHWTV